MIGIFSWWRIGIEATLTLGIVLVAVYVGSLVYRDAHAKGLSPLLRGLADKPGSKISRDHAGLLVGAGRSSTWKPRLRSSRIILRARTFLASVLTAGPRSS